MHYPTAAPVACWDALACVHANNHSCFACLYVSLTVMQHVVGSCANKVWTVLAVMHLQGAAVLCEVSRA